jgi:hypothetical protein
LNPEVCMRWIKKVTIGAVVTAALAGTAALADVIVVKSAGPSSKSYPAGKKLPNSAIIALKVGDSVTLLDTGGTRVLVGPTKVSAAASSRAGATMGPGLTSLMTSGRARRARTGAVRGGTGESTAQVRSPNLWYVDINQNTKTCLLDLTNVMLWRANSTQPAKVTITNAATKASGTVQFGKQQSVAPWPTGSVPVSDGTSFVISRSDTGRSQTVAVTKLLAKPDGLQATASELIAKGCQAQMDLLVQVASAADAGAPPQ